MRFPITLSLVLFLSSCSSGLKQSESIADKMARYKAAQYSDNKVPQINLPTTSLSGGRAPASFKPAHNKKPLSLSNKRLYFLTLHSQYQTLNKMLGSSSPEIAICPSFHTSLVKQKGEAKGLKVNEVEVSKLNFNDQGFHPELDLPITRGSVKPTVKDIMSDEGKVAVKNALQLHVEKTHSELQELCEFGNSDNYYTFENLYTLIKKKKVTGRSDKLSSLMKTTLFTNHLILKSLQQKQSMGRSPASHKSSYEKVLLNELFRRLESPVSTKDLNKLYRY